MAFLRDTSRTSRRIGGSENHGKGERLVELVEESVEAKIMGKVKDTSRTSERIGGRESHGKGERQ